MRRGTSHKPAKTRSTPHPGATSLSPATPSSASPSNPSTGRSQRLLARIATHDSELLRLGREMRAAAPTSSSHTFYKTRALQVLKQKRAMERRLERAMNAEYNACAARDEADALAALHLPVRADASALHGGGSGGAGGAGGALDGASEELEEILREAQEVGEVLSGGAGMEDAELEEELEADLEWEKERQGEYRAEAEAEAEADLLSRLSRLNGLPAPHAEVPAPYVAPPRGEGVRRAKTIRALGKGRGGIR